MAGDRTQIGIDIDAVDDASPTIDDVADKAKKLEELAPTVDVGADTSKADTALADVKADAERITGEDYRLVLKAQIDDAKAKLAQIDTDLDNLEQGSVRRAGHGVDDLGDKFGKAGDAAKGFAGGTASEIASMTGAFGPAGEAIGQMTEGLLEGEASMTGLLTAGAGIGAVALVMNELSAASERAAKRAQDVADSIKEINRASDDQVLQQFSTTVAELILNGTPLADYFADLAQGSIEGARRLLELLTAEGASKVYTDQLKAAIVEEERARKQQTTTTENYGDAAHDAAVDTAELTTKTNEAKTSADLAKIAFQGMRDELAKQDVIATFGETMAGAMEKIKGGAKLTRDEVDAIKQSIINAGEAAHLNPVVVQAELDKVDQGDIEGAWFDTQTRINKMGAIVFESRIKAPVLGKPAPDGGGTGGTFGATTINVNMPAGSRGVDVVRQLSGHARRAGRYYGAAVVTHARR